LKDLALHKIQQEEEGARSWSCVVFTGTSGGTSSFEQLEKKFKVFALPRSESYVQ